MVDPSILLQTKAPVIQTALDAQREAQQNANLGNVGQLQRGEIAMQPGRMQLQQGDIAQQGANLTAIGQENQGRAIALDQQRLINQGIAANIKPDASGKPAIDHAGVVNWLAQQPNGGAAAMQYQQHATAIQKTVTDLQTAQEKLNNEHLANYASAAGAVADAPAGAKPAAYHMFLQSGLANQQMQPGDWPADYDASLDGKIAATRKLGVSPQAQSEQNIQESGQKIALLRAQSQSDREQDYRDRITALTVHQAEQDRIAWARVGMMGANGGVTPNMSATVANQMRNEYNKAGSDERDADSTRMILGNQIQRGDFYVNDKTEPVPWSKAIPQKKDEDDDKYAARVAQEKPGYVQQMQTRLNAATVEANAATARKNAAMMKANPDIVNDPGFVSNEQAAAARGGKAPAAATPPTNAAPQPQAATPNAPKANAANDGQQMKVQLPGGKWISGTRGQLSKYLATKGMTLQ